MKMPSKCPICNGTLLNKYDDFADRTSILTKSCTKKLNHDVYFKSFADDHNTVAKVSTTYSLGLTAVWLPKHEALSLRSINKVELRLPYFEPNFSNYPKLIEKLKTYVMFS